MNPENLPLIALLSVEEFAGLARAGRYDALKTHDGFGDRKWSSGMSRANSADQAERYEELREALREAGRLEPEVEEGEPEEKWRPVGRAIEVARVTDRFSEEKRAEVLKWGRLNPQGIRRERRAKMAVFKRITKWLRGTGVTPSEAHAVIKAQDEAKAA